MCTVTYIPQGNNQFILTANRDENRSRNTSLLATQLVGTAQVSFPVDPVSGGSWIAISQNDRVACILNGAFEKHRHNPPYTRSRGLILLDFFKISDIEQFIARTKFEGIEPFTMIMYQRDLLMELRWDGTQKHSKQVPLLGPHIWSSSTLYNQHTRSKRATLFANWYEQTQNPDINELLRFHQYGGEPDTTDGFVMNRDNKVQTLSITGIEKKSAKAVLHHHDLITNTTAQRSIDFSRNEIMESY